MHAVVRANVERNTAAVDGMTDELAHAHAAYAHMN